jgi:hypothetical protein
MNMERDVEELRPERVHSHVQRVSAPAPGDVLVAKRTARADLYFISVVPGPAYRTARRHEEAVDAGREIARQRRVDGWFTCDHTHYARIARHRW